MRVVFFSSGLGSWAAAKRTVAEVGVENVTLLFADTLIEDEDNYRFLDEAAANVGAPLVRVADGRTPWQVFEAERFIGNSRIAPCSHILKQQVCRKWLAENAPGADVVVGIGWDEEHRLPAIVKNWSPRTVHAPMTAAPYLDRAGLAAWATSEGLTPPRLYGMGFPHANCGGFCVRAGQGQFALLRKTMPERYAAHAAEEERLRGVLGDVAVMRDRRGGGNVPLPMVEFAARLDRAPEQIDMFEWSGCGCFVEDE